MSRVVNLESIGKERNRLTKAIALAMRNLAQQPEINTETRDLAAFIALALLQIANGIESTVAAWEKRDYWVKADRFRMEWAWSGQLGEKLKQALLSEDWPQIARLSAQIAEKLGHVKVSEKHRLGTPWQGAYHQLTK
jgi:hypothetical protein